MPAQPPTPNLPGSSTRRIAIAAASLGAAVTVGFAVSGVWHQVSGGRGRAEAERRAEAAEAALAELTARQPDQVAVNAFLLDEILAASPPRAVGAGPPVREALDAAAGKIEGRFAGKPRLAASAEHTLGESYRKIGEYADAVKHLKRAVELRGALTPADPAGLAASRHALAVALTSAGKGKDALPLFRAALEGADPRFAAKVRRDLGLCLARFGEIDAAVDTLTTALAAQHELLGPDNAETITTLNALASAHVKAKRFDRVVELGREAVRRSRALGPDSVVLAYSLNTLGTGLARTGQLAEADKVLTAATDLHAKLIGPTHPDAVETAFGLARVLVDRQKWPEAEYRLRRAIPPAVEAFGPAHRMTCEMRMMRIVTLGQLGNAVTAESEAVELLAALRSVEGSDPAEVKAVEDTLAKIRKARAQKPVAPPPRPVHRPE